MKRKLLVGLLIALGVALTLFFGLRAFHAFGRIRNRRPPPPVMDVEMIRGWMTIPFISRGYQVPAPYLYDAIGIPPAGNHRRSLDELNATYFPDSRDIVIEKVKAAIQAYRAEHPPPPTPVPSGVPTAP